MKRRDLEKHLRQHGCVIRRHGGSHDYWENPTNGRHEAIPRHRELNTSTAAGICKGLGVPVLQKK